MQRNITKNYNDINDYINIRSKSNSDSSNSSSNNDDNEIIIISIIITMKVSTMITITTRGTQRALTSVKAIGLLMQMKYSHL